MLGIAKQKTISLYPTHTSQNYVETPYNHKECFLFHNFSLICPLPPSLSLPSLPPTQYSIIFPSQKIRNSWEEDFLRVKRSFASPLLTTPPSPSSSYSPGQQTSGHTGYEFLHPLHVQSGRAGMEVWGNGGIKNFKSTSKSYTWLISILLQL